MCICRSFLLDEVKLYALPASAESREAQHYLERNGIRYERLDVSADEGCLAEMERLSGQNSRPVILIGSRAFVGFSEDELAEVMP